MNFKTTAFLLVLATAVVAYFYFVESRSPAPGGTTPPSQVAGPQDGTAVLAAPPEVSTIDRVEVDIKATRLELVREGAEWQQVAPVKFPLNQWAVQGLIEQCLSLRYMRKFTPGGKDSPKLADLGLEKPQATIAVKAGGAKPFAMRVKVGQTTVGGRAYAMVDDGPEVYVVGDVLYKALLTQRPEEWRSRTLRNIPSFRENRAELISLARPGQSAVELVRREREWALGGAHTGRVDPRSVETLLSSLMTLHIDKFVSDGGEDLALYGLDKPQISLTLRSLVAPADPIPPTKSPSTQPSTQPVKTLAQTLRIGLPDPSGSLYFATWSAADERPQVVFTIPKSDRDKFEKSVNDFRDPRLTPLGLTEIKELSVERVGEAIRLLRDSSGNWSFGDPAPDFKADTDAVGSMLDDTLIISRAEGFVANANPSGTPLATVKLTATARPEPDVIRVFEPARSAGAAAGTGADEQYLVLRNNETTGMLVPRARLARLLQPPIALRDRVVLRAGQPNLRRVEIRRGGVVGPGALSVLERGESSAQTAPTTAPTASPAAGPLAWKLLGGQQVDAASLQTLLGAVAPLRAETWTAEGRLDPADEKGAIDIQILDAQGQTHAARVYPVSRLGKVEGVKAMFRVSVATLEALRAELRDRTIVAADVEDLKSVRVSQGGSDATLVVNRDELGSFANPEGKNLSQANCGALFDALASLRAEQYVDEPGSAAAAPARRIELTLKGDRRVSIDLPTGPGLERTSKATLPDGTVRWFTLAEDVAKKLRADLVAASKDPMPAIPAP